MENEIEKAFRLTMAQMGYDDRTKYSYDMARVSYEMSLAKLEAERDFISKHMPLGGIYLDEFQRTKDITDLLNAEAHRIVVEGLGYEPELLMRITNVTDIVALSHDIQRSCINGVHLKYERQQNRLDVYFEKAQDYVLVKMFTE